MTTKKEFSLDFLSTKFTIELMFDALVYLRLAISYELDQLWWYKFLRIKWRLWALGVQVIVRKSSDDPSNQEKNQHWIVYW